MRGFGSTDHLGLSCTSSFWVFWLFLWGCFPLVFLCFLPNHFFHSSSHHFRIFPCYFRLDCRLNVFPGHAATSDVVLFQESRRLVSTALSRLEVIDNLTATIVCIKILQRVVPHNQEAMGMFLLQASLGIGNPLEILLNKWEGGRKLVEIDENSRISLVLERKPEPGNIRFFLKVGHPFCEGGLQELSSFCDHYIRLTKATRDSEN